MPNVKKPLLIISTDTAPVPLKRHRFTRFGSRMYDPSSGDKKKWIRLVREKCKFKLYTHALRIECVFTFKRPKSHYRTGKFRHLIKENAPKDKISKPDIDNLCKFYLDAMNNVIFTDDSQIVQIHASKKYGERNNVSIRLFTV
jgi:Holliday junction resolvase RusA-like endonuclease